MQQLQKYLKVLVELIGGWREANRPLFNLIAGTLALAVAISGAVYVIDPGAPVSLAVLMVVGITMFRGDGTGRMPVEAMAVQTVPGTAVGDLQALDKNHDLYSDFDVLDDLEVQQNVGANP